METPLIYARISACLAEVGAVGKDHKNQAQGYAFRGIDDFYDKFQPVLARNKVFIAPTILEHTREERTTKSGGTLMSTITKVRFKIYTEDGSFIEADALGEGSDSGDKSANKAAASAMKYLFMQVFSVRVNGESFDTERESHAYAPKPAQAAQAAPKPYALSNDRQYQKNAPAPAHEPKPPPPPTYDQKWATPLRRANVNKYLDEHFSLPDLDNFFGSKGWEREWPLAQVPVTNAALAELEQEIKTFLSLQCPPDANEAPAPDSACLPLVDTDDLPAELRSQIITLPRKGMKRAEYMLAPDTIGSLWDGSADDKKRLFGCANHWQPESWIGNDGALRPPSAADAECRIALDLFLDFIKTRKGGESPE